MFSIFVILLIFYLDIYKVFSRHTVNSCDHNTERNVVKESKEYSYGILGPGLNWRGAPDDLNDYIRNLPFFCRSETKLNCKYKNSFSKLRSNCMNYTLSELTWTDTFIISSKPTCEGDYCKLQSEPRLFQNAYKNLHFASHRIEKWPVIREWASQFVPKSLPDNSAFALSTEVSKTTKAKIWMKILTLKATVAIRDQAGPENSKPDESPSSFYLPLKFRGGGIIIRIGVA